MQSKSQKKTINFENGDRIRQAREAAGLTQERFAEQIDASPQYISDMERSIVGMSLTTFKKVCIALGVTSDSILFGMHPGNDASSILACVNTFPEKRFNLLEEIILRSTEAVRCQTAAGGFFVKMQKSFHFVKYLSNTY